MDEPWSRAHVVGLLVLVLIIEIHFLVHGAGLHDVEKRSATSPLYTIEVNTTHSQYTTDLRFLSLAMGPSLFARLKTSKKLDVNNTRFQNLAKALAPADVRIGGSWANFLIFNDGRKHPVSYKNMVKWAEALKHFNVTVEEYWTRKIVKYTNTILEDWQWKAVLKFCEHVGWDVTMDLNRMILGDGGGWDPRNAKFLLDYTVANNLKLSGLQLGNEPNSFPHNFKYEMTVDMVLEGYRKLKDLLKNYPTLSHVKLIGPETTSIGRNKWVTRYLRRFMDLHPDDVIDELGMHHYYVNGKNTTVDEFMDPEKLNMMKLLTTRLSDILNDYNSTIRTRLTETGSAYGGGAPSLSNAFADLFMWLDELGLAAAGGIKLLNRQTFFSGHYALVGYYDPNPSYYFSVLYKRLILGPVLSVNFTTWNEKIRMYAHCARTDVYNYKPGDIVIYYSNMLSNPVTFDLAQFKDKQYDLFQMTKENGSDDPSSKTGLQTKLVKLNGNLLTTPGEELPEMQPQPGTGTVQAEPYSVGFIVVKDAGVSLCQ